MTTTRIDHTGHTHANTTAARTACRKAIAAPQAALAIATPVSRTNIAGSHCAGCGNRSKAVDRSRCCRARVVDVCQPTTLCYHD